MIVNTPAQHGGVACPESAKTESCNDTPCPPPPTDTTDTRETPEFSVAYEMKRADETGVTVPTIAELKGLSEIGRALVEDIGAYRCPLPGGAGSNGFTGMWHVLVIDMSAQCTIEPCKNDPSCQCVGELVECVCISEDPAECGNGVKSNVRVAGVLRMQTVHAVPTNLRNQAVDAMRSSYDAYVCARMPIEAKLLEKSELLAAVATVEANCKADHHTVIDNKTIELDKDEAKGVRARDGAQATEWFTPEVYFDGVWRPVCGHCFWDNNEGASRICMDLQLGFTAGKVRKVGSAPYPEDSMPIGTCKSQDNGKPQLLRRCGQQSSGNCDGVVWGDLNWRKADTNGNCLSTSAKKSNQVQIKCT